MSSKPDDTPYFYNKTDDHKNPYVPDTHHPDNLPSKYHEYHYFSFSDYLWLFLIAALLFSYGCYYFYSQVRKYLQRISINPEEETKVEQSKNDMYKNISIYCLFRLVTVVICFILGNPDYNDFTSFILRTLRVFPFILLFSIMLNHVSFLIEKYYQIKYKKTDLFFNPSLEILNIIVYIVFTLFTFACLLKEKYNIYLTLTNGLLAFITAVISILYFYYGISLSNIYSSKKGNIAELKEKKFLHNKLLGLALSVGVLMGLKSLLSYLLCLDLLNIDRNSFLYPYFNKNVWDFINILLFEFGVIISLGMNKQSLSKTKADSVVYKLKDSNMFVNEVFNEYMVKGPEYNLGVKGSSGKILNEKREKQGQAQGQYKSNDYFNENELLEPLINQ